MINRNKNGTLDRRFRVNKPITAPARTYLQENGKLLLAVACLAFLLAVAVVPSVYYYFNPRPLLSPLAKPIVLRATQEVKAFETPCDFDAITYIRCRGEQLGYSNKVIKTAIRIARAESNFRPNARNPKSSATGVFQFLWSTWDAYKCEGEKWDFVDNVNCFYKLYAEQTARYSKKGLIYDFNDWNASRSKWEE